MLVRRKAGFFSRIKTAWRVLRSGVAYSGAELSRLVADWICGIRTADDEVRADSRRMRARARHLSRNVGYVHQYLNLLQANVIGHKGMTMQAQVKSADGTTLDKPINDRIEAAWNDWASGPVTVDGKLDLVNLELLLMKSVGRDGEVFVRMLTGPEYPHGTALQPIDPDLIDEQFNRAAGGGLNEIRMGIEIDTAGRPVRYWVNTVPPGVLGSMGGDRHPVPAEEMVHLYRLDRVGQTRGITWLAAGMYPMKILDGYEEAELVASRTAAAKMGFVSPKDDLVGTGIVPVVAAGQSQPPTSARALTMQAAPGTIETLPANWTFQQWDPQHPTTAHGSFVKTALRKLSGAFGVLYNTLAGDLEGVNYGSMRGGLLVERDLWRVIQQFWIGSLLSS